MRGSFADEASRCRSQAAEFAGKPEQPFLLKLSAAFEELALIRNGEPQAHSPRGGGAAFRH
jgi:hypothetical protein